jgi:hypothetical protein
MSDHAQAVLGGFYFFGAIFLFGLLYWWLSRRVGGRIQENQRRRQIETAMHLDACDRRLIKDVADEWGYDARRLGRRRIGRR